MCFARANSNSRAVRINGVCPRLRFLANLFDACELFQYFKQDGVRSSIVSFCSSDKEAARHEFK